MFVEPDVNGKAAAGLRQRRLFTCSLAELIEGSAIDRTYPAEVKDY